MKLKMYTVMVEASQWNVYSVFVLAPNGETAEHLALRHTEKQINVLDVNVKRKAVELILYDPQKVGVFYAIDISDE